MANAEFDVDLFETRLENLKNTQDGITQMSTWCLAHRMHHKKIVISWLNVLKRVRVEARVTLFYLANDVIQYSRRKHFEFVESWGTALQRATTMVRDEKVKPKILRIFKIWEQRNIYGDDYISDLIGLLNMPPPRSAQRTDASPDDFQVTALITDIRESVRLGLLTDKTFNRIPKEPTCDMETIKSNLKEKHNSGDIDKEIDGCVESLQLFIASLRNEIRIRKTLILNVKKASTFYQSQKGEVKVVINAYKHFGNRIKAVKKKLEEVIPTLPSPMPSPDINAPSPEPDADLQLPEDFTFNTTNGFSGFLDAKLPFDINDFKSESSQPIEVISNRPEDIPPEVYIPTNFYKPNSYPQPVPAVSSEYSSLAQVAAEVVSAANNAAAYKSQNTSTNYYNTSNYGSESSYDGGAAPPPPMPPPSLVPPPLPVPMPVSAPEDFNSTWDMDMTWTSINSNSSFMDTPLSPSSFIDRDGGNLTSLLEYGEEDDSENIEDVDHRQFPDLASTNSKLPINHARISDIDHRNLISLTGSPLTTKISEEEEYTEESPWTKDQDFRSAAMKLRNLNGTVSQNVSTDIDYRNLQPPPMPPSFEFPNLFNLSPTENKLDATTELMNKTVDASIYLNLDDDEDEGGYDPTDKVESIDMDMSDDLTTHPITEKQLGLSLIEKNHTHEVEIPFPPTIPEDVPGTRPPLLATPEQSIDSFFESNWMQQQPQSSIPPQYQEQHGEYQNDHSPLPPPPRPPFRNQIFPQNFNNFQRPSNPFASTPQNRTFHRGSMEDQYANSPQIRNFQHGPPQNRSFHRGSGPRPQFHSPQNFRGSPRGMPYFRGGNRGSFRGQFRGGQRW